MVAQGYSNIGQVVAKILGDTARSWIIRTGQEIDTVRMVDLRPMVNFRCQGRCECIDVDPAYRFSEEMTIPIQNPGNF